MSKKHRHPKAESSVEVNLQPEMTMDTKPQKNTATKILSDLNKPKIKQTWGDIDSLRDSIANYVAQMADDINASVELVKQVGCDHIEEFNVAVQKTNRDFEKFLTDFEKVKASHEGKAGLIDSPEETALAIQVFENYNQFYTYFSGVMHHSLISFTEYALEAKSRLEAQMREEQATKDEEIKKEEKVDE